MRHLSGGQIDGFVQQIGIAQAAQGKAQTVCSCTGTETGPQIGPSLTDLVFIHGL